MPKKSPDVSFRDSILFDQLASPIEFKELTQTVETIMLSNPLERSPVAKPSGERAVMAALGCHGLRVALEYLDDVEDNCELVDEVSAFDMIYSPEEFVGKEVPGVAEWATDFGEALLSEAYKCLGKDAEEMLTAYREATTASEQMEILDWLDARLWDMYGPEEMESSPAELEEGLFYHPIRLSPKVIGVYPDIEISPTCLGYSIIAASFLYNTGSPTLHAGVMVTDNQSDIVVASEVRAQVSEDIVATSGGDTDLSDSLYESATQTMTNLYGYNGGYHAIALTRLCNGWWAQVDPMFRHSIAFSQDEFNDSLDVAYEDLEDFVEEAPPT